MNPRNPLLTGARGDARPEPHVTVPEGCEAAGRRRGRVLGCGHARSLPSHVATGRGSWSFRYRPREGGKKNERITFGTTDELTLAEARDRAARVRAEVVDGGNPQLTRREKRAAAKRVLTLDALAQRYLE